MLFITWAAIKAGMWLENTPSPSLVLNCHISGKAEIFKKEKGPFARAWSFSATCRGLAFIFIISSNHGVLI